VTIPRVPSSPTANFCSRLRGNGPLCGYVFKQALVIQWVINTLQKTREPRVKNLEKNSPKQRPEWTMPLSCSLKDYKGLATISNGNEFKQREERDDYVTTKRSFHEHVIVGLKVRQFLHRLIVQRG
jgi:hypothetical protein